MRDFLYIAGACCIIAGAAYYLCLIVFAVTGMAFVGMAATELCLIGTFCGIVGAGMYGSAIEMY